MTITFPVDLLADWPGWSPRFELMRRQEQSRTTGGKTIVKDFGSPLWAGSWVSRTLSPNELDHWRARLDALEEGLQTFRGYALSRCYPIAYPQAAYEALGIGAVTVSALGGNNKSCRVTGLSAGYQVSIGDMIAIAGSGLHRVMEAVTADNGGVSPYFELRPHFAPGAAVGAAVQLVRPSCLMQVVPGSITADADPQTGRGTISFDGMEVL